MAATLLEPLAKLIGRGDAKSKPRRRCPHCGDEGSLWPTGLGRDGGPCLCTACAGLCSQQGEAQQIDPTTARVGPVGGAGAATPPPLPDQARLNALLPVLKRVVGRRLSISDSPPLEQYLRSIFDRVGFGDAHAPLLLIDLGEPAIAAWPRGGVVISLGLLATLEDEAQLAFVLAREAVLDEAGWLIRRVGSCLAAHRRLIGSRKRQEEEAIGEWLDAGIRVGYGHKAESVADRDALGRLVRAGYDPRAGGSALRLLEAASLEGRGGRFLLAADRGRFLGQSVEILQQTGRYALNREVYRRAVGGFSVFAAR